MMNKQADRPLRKTFLLLALALLLALPGLTPAEQAAPEPQLLVNPGKALTLYAQPDRKADRLGQLYRGEAVELLEQSEGWARVRRYLPTGQAETGWVMDDGLRPVAVSDGPAFALVNSPDPALRAQLHTGSSAKSRVLGKYFNGVLVRVLQPAQGDWVKVGIGSLEGFMRLEQLALSARPDGAEARVPTATVQNPRDPGLTLRAGQSYQSDKLGGYSNGTQVRVLGVTEEFAQVQTADGQLGFMMASGLSPQPIYADIDPGAYTQQPEGALSVVDNPAGQGAHLRQKGSTSSPSLGLYPNGTQVVVTGGTAWWKQVWVEGRTGYMMATLIRGFVPSEDGGEDDWVMEDWLDSWEGTWVDGESP